MRLIEARGERAPETLGGERFAAVLCHAVIMYVEPPEPFLAALCDLAEPGGVLSIVAANAKVSAVRPALEGRWADALPSISGAGRDVWPRRRPRGASFVSGRGGRCAFSPEGRRR